MADQKPSRSFTFDTSTGGACVAEICVTLRGDLIEDVAFVGGCEGNHAGIARLVRGRRAGDVIPLLRGTPCGQNPTSCPDQLALALQAALANPGAVSG
jgi:uncharacterized protein (TIGR03905 family)